MLRTRQIIFVITAVLGVLLIVRGAWGGVWPVSIQLIAGVLLLVFAGLRWWTMR
jgi:drug/metabolite transporter (DMT)-like permease